MASYHVIIVYSSVAIFTSLGWVVHRHQDTARVNAKINATELYVIFTFPGLNNAIGSTVRFMAFISFTVPIPSSGTRYSFLPTPTPCSPVPVQSA